jgi:hypothetical protein
MNRKINSWKIAFDCAAIEQMLLLKTSQSTNPELLQLNKKK